MKLYMLPKYNELDLTPFFAPFLLCSFRAVFGRFGLWSVYGIRRNCLSYVGEECVSMKPILTLVQILGCFFLLRYADRYFFGFNLYGNDIPFFNKMRDLFLDNQWMFNLSLILGAVQIIFGYDTESG